MSLTGAEERLFDFGGDWLERLRTAVGPGELGRLGPYRLLEEVGRGGQGVVFRAVQPGTGRTIAVKRLLAGSFASPSSLRRFQREAEAAAALVHPGIVTVHGVEMVDGAPLLSMEWVDGVPVTDWARGRARREVLAVFLQVCEAVQYAHHGVLHRDLKPANVLVDSTGRPRLLDFGLAKLPEVGGSALTSSLTTSGGFLGTPAYAAPEQIRGEPADARTDIHALGAVLFELLTGGRVIEDDGLEALARAVEREPVRPSSRDASIQRDLDAILLQAMASDPARRYQSVDALTADLRRFLDGRPVLAHGPGAFYLLRKLVARNRAASAAVLLLVTATVVFGVASFRQARRLALERDRALVAGKRESDARLQADEEKKRALAEKARAEEREREADQARAELQSALEASERTLDFLTHDIVTGISPLLSGHVPTMIETLESAARGIPERFQGMPAAEESVRRSLAQTFDALGESHSAEREIRRALELLQELERASPEERAECEGLLGRILLGAGAYEEARKYLESSIAWYESEGQERPGSGMVRTALYDLRNLALNRGRPAEALEVIERLIETETDASVRLVFEDARLAAIARLGRFQEALHGYEELLPRTVERFGADHVRVGTVLLNTATVHNDLRQFEESAELSRRALGVFERANGPTHPDVARALTMLSLDLNSMGRYEEAAPLVERSLSILRAAGVGGTGLMDALLCQAQILQQRASGAHDPALFVPAATVFQEIASFYEQEGGRGGERWSVAQYRLHDCLLGAERFEEADALLEQLRGLSSQLSPGWLLTRRAMSAERRGADDEALELYDQAVAALESENQDLTKQDTFRRFAALCRRRGDEVSAVDLERRAAALARPR